MGNEELGNSRAEVAKTKYAGFLLFNMVGQRSRRLLQLRDEAGKFSKSDAYYVDDAFQKSVRCGNCFHYTGDGKCALVSEEGTPGEGRINPQGACSMFNARPPRITAIQMLWGRGGLDGVAPEVIRATAFMYTYAGLDEEPPAELREKALIDPNTIARLLPGSSNPVGEEYE